MSANSGRLLMSVEEAGHALGISRSTIYRMIRRGSIRSVRKDGRRLISKQVISGGGRQATRRLPPFTLDHPIFRLLGAGRSGGNAPGARDKHAILDQ
jgi:excisionase family DNA binding protein